MAKNVTLSQLRTDARLYADQRDGGGSQYINDTELNRLINLKLAELYDLLVSARGHEYYLSEDTVSTLSDDLGTSTKAGRYTLPSDFYQLSSVTLEWGADDNELMAPVNSVSQRTSYTNWNQWHSWAPKGYRLRAGVIEIIPKPTSAVTARLQYIPAFQDLSGDSATFDGVNGWEKLVALGVAIEMRTIRKDPSGDLERRYQEQYSRVQDMAADRDAENASEVRDVQPEGFYRAVWPPLPGRVVVS